MNKETSEKQTRYVDPLTEFGGLLLKTEKPARYTGGETGALAAEHGEAKDAVSLATNNNKNDEGDSINEG